MHGNSSSNILIELRSGRVVIQKSRERPPRKVRRSGSAPPITFIHESPRNSPQQRKTMGNQNDEQVPPEEELHLSHYSNSNIVNAPSFIVHPHPNVVYEIEHVLYPIHSTYLSWSLTPCSAL